MYTYICVCARVHMWSFQNAQPKEKIKTLGRVFEMCWSVLDILVNVKQDKLKYRICQISLDILNKWWVSLYCTVFYLKKHQLDFLTGFQHVCNFWCATGKIKLERGERPFCVSVVVALKEVVEPLLRFWRMFCSHFTLTISCSAKIRYCWLGLTWWCRISCK